MNSSSEIIKQRYQKLEEIRKKGIDPYPYRFDVSHPAQKILESAESLIESEQTITVAGRLISQRHHGKTSFAHILDRTGQIQIYIRKDRIAEDAYELYNDLIDVGDYVGIHGTIFRTRTGEVTVIVANLALLSKSLRSLPEKWHGLQDVETRYRQRYVDLIVNPGVREIFQTRARFIRSIQRFMDGQDFIEVETPVLQPLYGGALARPFVTHHNALDTTLYLRISDELYLKRLIVGGLERVYEIGHDFRNEGMDRTHNPEFTMMEFYQAYADYNDVLQLTEKLITTAIQETIGTLEITYQDQVVNLALPWRQIPMLEAIHMYADVDVSGQSDEELAQTCKRLNVDVDSRQGRGKMIDALFESFVQPKLLEPTFITDYPIEISPLSKKHRKTDGLVERFELFMFGYECANAFSELNDPVDQRERFEYQAELQELGDDEAHALDEDYIRALEYGMPPTGGCGIGIDRLMMFITNSPSIKDVLLFPAMRPESNARDSEAAS